MQFARSRALRSRHREGFLPFAGAQMLAPDRRRDLAPCSSEPRPEQTQAPATARIRYAFELIGAGIMMAGFLALAILG